MKWLILAAALLLETLGFVALKLSAGFARPLPATLAVAADLLALVCFVLALRRFETSFVYLAATGGGTALVVLANLLVFGQPLSAGQLVCVVLILVGIVGLHRLGHAY